MNRISLCFLLLSFPIVLVAQARPHQQGTIIRMRTADCLGPQHGFMAAMSGGKAEAGMLCPEYVLLADKVVYVIIGKTSGQLLPLAEVTAFRFQTDEMLIRINDAPKESHFRIKAMMLRAEWERNQMREEAEGNASVSHHLDAATIREPP